VWLVFGSNWQTLTPKIISVYTSFLSPRHPKFNIFDFKISCPPFSFPWIMRAGVFRAYLLMQCYRVFFFNIFFVLNYFLNVFFLLFYYANITKLILKKLKKHFKNNYSHGKQNRIIKQHTWQYPSYPSYWQMVYFMNLIRGEVTLFEHAGGTSFDRIEAWSKDYMVVVF
jgi:hypothetical protein